MTVGSVNPFNPAGTVAIAATSTSASTALPAKGDTVVVTNPTASLAFVRVGNGPQSASEGDMPVPAGTRARIFAGPYVNQIGAVMPGGSGTIYATVGNGTEF
ncbi:MULTISPECIES: hypothetical protein [Acidiphilium]|uniref:Uncharacterized protein n=1 Tax=Acidiphilium cryptum (strain JF-5) TaxID=349163 RepID=A5G0W0_ACICJ|nr:MULTISPECIES: hypothetical protein [Acidiphilium]ABQ31492.1 hypothetical protein Acry_2297 [Acidiphilium cryptum JF-5]OYV54212.1 MAG: hypothetical protein B7Z76_15285 [Acidiphilium sp. 20-67-58]OYV84538.1 MAG: hypothetical protein B7Z64_07565 [Acidiphilium sp. 21-68-69]HQT62627.1 hypothetical protein [Acidiphilium sp.]